MADDYASHYPILAAAVNRTAEPVLECGMGEGSSPMLHYMCKLGGRLLISMETDGDWILKYNSYSHPQHIIKHLTSPDRWAWVDEYIPGNPFFGVVFVDNAPGHVRSWLIEHFKDRARFIIAHDSERDWASGANYGYERVKPMFKHVTEFRRWRPYTLVLSNFQPFPIEACDREWVPSPEQMAVYQKEGIKK